MDKGRYREELRALEESCKPINEAIARQSVTDEDMQEAIEYYRHIANITKGEESLAEISANLAITALQADKLPSAIKWTGNNLREIINLTGWNESASSKWTWEEYEQVVKEKGLKIFTPDGSAMAGIGDWIVRDGDSCHILQAYQPKPTSEESQEAIEWATEELNDSIRYQHNYKAGCLDTIVTALQAYQPTISKTETDGCECCDSGIDTASLMGADMMMRFVRRVNFCPNCGRRLEGE